MSVTFPCQQCGKPVTFPGFSTADPAVVAEVLNAFCDHACQRRYQMRLVQPSPPMGDPE